MKNEELVMLPGPVNVDHKVLLSMATAMFNHRGPKFNKLFMEVKEKLRKVLNTSGEIYFITGSGTAGNEFAVSNLVAPGDKVVVCTNGYFADRLRDTFKVYGANVVEVKSEWGRGVDLESLKSSVDGATIVALVFNETSTGVLNQVREVVQIAKKAGALCFVDNVSGVGNNYEMDPWGIDVTVTATQKGLATPPGAAFVAMSNEAREKAARTPKRSFYFDIELFDRAAEDHSTPATPAISVINALNTSLDEILEEGVERFVTRHSVNAEAFRRGVEAMGLELFADRQLASNTVSAIKIGGKARLVANTMRDRFEVIVTAGLGKYRDDVLRVGHMGRVDMKDIVTTLSALELSLKEIGVSGARLGEGVSAALDYYSSNRV
ncbi:MAG: alanine--glyoxylate aminotransferase family protein [Thermoprotei archaeon]